MSAPARPCLKSLTDTPTDPRAAEPAAPPPTISAVKGAARQGVVTALRPNRHAPADPSPDRPGIRIFAPPVYRHYYDGARWSKRYASTPTAAYACTCGDTGTATGPEDVAALVADYDAHKSACPGTPATPTEERAAA
ncbi:hypothetical protein ACIRJO_42085 [Streptomyces sp. NPDC102394]|uniref:hypothetical protein n=1 Tax=Streptomyces sp. NPDC102394 TaxID=3366167 RepID=UPI0038161FEB